VSDFKVGRIAVISVWAEDVRATAHFYQDVLGLEPLNPDPDHAHLTRFHLSEGYLIILKGQPRPAENSEPSEFPLFALTVDDLDSAVDRLKAHQVPLPRGVERFRQSRWVMFHDPAGNLIELVQGH
jgi:catechol 2,3-dioxygenase-like lactoylglutathione lyase family enzyme